MKTENTVLRWMAGATVALVMGAPLAKGHEAPDAARMWEQFLKTADAGKAYDALAVLDAVGYDIASVDSAKCSEHRDAMQAAVAAAPVSIAIRRAAFLCADALNDSATADREMNVLAALSQYAMKQTGPEPLLTDPIRVMAPADAYALVESLGLKVRYEYYGALHPARYFPLVIAAWDDDAKHERRLRFDYVDTAYTLSRTNTLAGFPMLRTVMARAFVEGGIKGDRLTAIDIDAVQTSVGETKPEDKVAKLRRAANAGGMQAAIAWMVICTSTPKYADCTDGLVDALLPEAEEDNAIAMVLLSFAYQEGVGVKRDSAAAWTLLDKAERIQPQEALIDFVSFWSVARNATPLPAEVEQRLARASKSVKAARLVAIQRKADGKAQLDPADLAFLADPAVNRRGQGLAVLVDYYAAAGKQKEQQDATVKAALAGATVAKFRYASALVSGNSEGIPRDVEKGEALMAEAAHEGNARAGLYKAWLSLSAAKFSDAEGWALAPASSADLDSLMFLADLYTQDRPGVSGKTDRALRIYESMAEAPDGAPARRALAELALRGRGMDKDAAKAKQWLQTDAQNGDHESEAMLGYHYLKGDFGKDQESQGLQWMERAIAGDNERAFVEYGAWLFHKNDPKSRAEALRIWGRGDAAGHVTSINSYAWALCTAVHDDAYDPARGLEMSKRLGNVETMVPWWLDTVAACEAAVGNFKRAATLQERAATQMAALDTEQEERKGKPAGYKQRLDLYRAGKAFRDDDSSGD
ncbi:tetratricopeptide repeat protein [Lysobacter terrae]